LCDKFLSSGNLNKKQVRILFTWIGFTPPVFALIGLSFVTCATPYIGVALLIIGVSFSGCNYGAGYLINVNDIGGQYSGIVFGIMNTFATVPGIISPFIVSIITANVKILKLIK
jgi:MFS transporter, ACS family, solute carrier family 17 (sodium-dependent inorganic phosphate cotransporter), member 5